MRLMLARIFTAGASLDSSLGWPKASQYKPSTPDLSSPDGTVFAVAAKKTLRRTDIGLGCRYTGRRIPTDSFSRLFMPKLSNSAGVGGPVRSHGPSAVI